MASNYIPKYPRDKLEKVSWFIGGIVFIGCIIVFLILFIKYYL